MSYLYAWYHISMPSSNCHCPIFELFWFHHYFWGSYCCFQLSYTAGVHCYHLLFSCFHFQVDWFCQSVLWLFLQLCPVGVVVVVTLPLVLHTVVLFVFLVVQSYHLLQLTVACAAKILWFSLFWSTCSLTALARIAHSHTGYFSSFLDWCHI